MIRKLYVSYTKILYIIRMLPFLDKIDSMQWEEFGNKTWDCRQQRDRQNHFSKDEKYSQKPVVLIFSKASIRNTEEEEEEKESSVKKTEKVQYFTKVQ